LRAIKTFYQKGFLSVPHAPLLRAEQFGFHGLKQSKTFKVRLGPPYLPFNDSFERARSKGLPRFVKMKGCYPPIWVHKKAICSSFQFMKTVLFQSAY
jgi:hypothetical protein